MKDIKAVESEISSYLAQSRNGLSKENLKLDYKRQWWNLKDKESISEFLKDTSAIANTVGLVEKSELLTTVSRLTNNRLTVVNESDISILQQFSPFFRHSSLLL